MKYLGLAHILADGFAGVGGVGAMIAYLGPAHILADRFAGVGGGWDDNVPWPLGTWLDTQDGAKRSESYGAKRSDSDGAKRSSDRFKPLICGSAIPPGRPGTRLGGKKPFQLTLHSNTLGTKKSTYGSFQK